MLFHVTQVHPITRCCVAFWTAHVNIAGCNITKGQLAFYWIDDHHKHYQHMLDADPANCQKGPEKYRSLYVCFDYSGVPPVTDGRSAGVHHYFFAYDVSTFTYYCIPRWKENQRSVSWKTAFYYCSSAGGSLPIFSSRDELDGFIALLKLSPYKYSHIVNIVNSQPSPERFEMVFLGLVANTNQKV